MNLWAFIGLVVLLFLGTACGERIATDTVTSTAPEESAADGEWLVSRVVDGDTIEVTRGGDKEKVRLIGIDAPESVDPRRPVECFGKAASARVKLFLDGRSVVLESDESQGDRDKYDRLLRYVILPDGTDVGEVLVRDGFAHEYTYDEPYRYRDLYKDAEEQAKIAKRGLWADGACEDEGKPTKVLILRPKIIETASGLSMRGDAAEFLTPDTGMYEVALADGECTAESIEKGECLDSHFYLRNKGYDFDIKLADGAEVSSYDYTVSDIAEHMIVRPASDYLKEDLPNLVEVEITDGLGNSLREFYVP